MTTSNWSIDATHSGINFSVRHMVVSKVRGRFAKYTGTIGIDDADLTRSVVEAGGVLVGDRVEIELDIEAVRAVAQNAA